MNVYVLILFATMCFDRVIAMCAAIVMKCFRMYDVTYEELKGKDEII